MSSSTYSSAMFRLSAVLYSLLPLSVLMYQEKACFHTFWRSGSKDARYQLQQHLHAIRASPPATPSPSSLIESATKGLMERFWTIDQQTKRNMDKILSLYEEEKVDAASFHGVDGYGHGDIGREKLDAIIAKLMGAEEAAVRLQFFSGTHAIASALFGALRPGDNMVCVSGHPYDTLEEVIGQRDGHQTGSRIGSLQDWGIGYGEIELLEGEEAQKESGDRVAFDLKAIDTAIEKDPRLKLIHIQRSCGYKWRPSIPVLEIGRLCEHIRRKYKERGRDVVIFVDNCYGELVEDIEPCHVGADICAGSLIKNLGGTLAPSGLRINSLSIIPCSYLCTV